MAHEAQSRPDSGLGFQVKALATFHVFRLRSAVALPSMLFRLRAVSLAWPVPSPSVYFGNTRDPLVVCPCGAASSVRCQAKREQPKIY